MISPEEFVSTLKKRKFLSFTGVPCSFFQAAINHVLADKELRYTMVPNEGSALALASGAYLSGNLTSVLIQNSGFGNLINPLTSLNMIYKIPVLIFMSGRAYGVPDEPQHEIIGKTMNKMLEAMGVRFEDLPDELERFEESLDHAIEWMNQNKLPFFFLVRKGCIDLVGRGEVASPLNGRGNHAPTKYPMKRIEAIKIISEALKGNEVVIATTGKPSRELFSVCDRKENFYMQGSMGHAASIGLGVALSRSEKKVIVLDGDGAVLMHMGILSSVGFYKPANFYHIVLDNESYETTGDQDTTSPTTDFKEVAKACGYSTVKELSKPEDLKQELKRLLVGRGPVLLRVKINRLPTDEIPRISGKYSSETIARNFQSQIQA